MCLCWLDRVTEAETMLVTDKGDLVLKLPRHRTGTNWRPCSSEAITCLIRFLFFFSSQPSSWKSPPGFLLPRLKGWGFQGCIFNTCSQGGSLLWLWMEEMPWQGWPGCACGIPGEKLEARGAQCDCRAPVPSLYRCICKCFSSWWELISPCSLVQPSRVVPVLEVKGRAFIWWNEKGGECP